MALWAAHRHRVLSRRLGARRRLHIRTKMSGNCHASVHGVHIVVRRLPRETWQAIHSVRRGHGRRPVWMRRHRGFAIHVIILVIRTSRALVLHRHARCECRRRSCLRLFNSARVMILVTRQGRATRECFLTIRIGTFVRPFAGVYATMTCQRAGI